MQDSAGLKPKREKPRGILMFIKSCNQRSMSFDFLMKRLAVLNPSAIDGYS
jgi:hypothetical protein